MRVRSLMLIVLAATALPLLLSACGGSTTAATLAGRLLSLSDLPAGWRAAPADPGAVRLTNTPCLSSLIASPKELTYKAQAFVEGSSIPTFVEVLAGGPKVEQTWRRLGRALASCRTATIVLGGKKVRSSIRAISFPRIGASSSAYAWSFTLSGIRIGFDLVLFRVGPYGGYVSYSDLGPPRVAAVKAFARAAAAKLAKGSTARIPDAVSIASEPVRTVQTRLGTVAYRTIGSGPPLLLITGYSGTMEGWDPRFVDALAQRYRVVIFDNAGVGRTQALPAPLTIDAMANQTSALIAALGLKRVDVLGWSMGSMIAEALAVLHPARVRRLVLCAAYPANGKVVRPSRKELNAFESGDPKRVMAALFPAEQTAVGNTYLAAISSYPAAAPAPAAVVGAQGRAVDDWWAGKDAAGKRAARIAVPTLIADGREDRLDPLANSRRLARLIHGGKLALYPAAGHAFLFQDQAAFVPLVESFLG